MAEIDGISDPGPSGKGIEDLANQRIAEMI